VPAVRNLVKEVGLGKKDKDEHGLTNNGCNFRPDSMATVAVQGLCGAIASGFRLPMEWPATPFWSATLFFFSFFNFSLIIF
jgi:hypothetical protein